jgi:rhodanese-related sulfurtransferase
MLASPIQEPVMNATVPLPRLDARAARRMLDQEQAVIIDVREPAEFAREHIEGAVSAPLSGLEAGNLAIEAGEAAIFLCRSGARTAMNGALLRGKGPDRSYILDGGLESWKRAGFPVRLNRRVPIDLMRQVQIAAGSLAFAGTALGALASPWFLVVPGFVGAGLAVAGVTGFCGMARLLRLAPWNRAHFATR